MSWFKCSNGCFLHTKTYDTNLVKDGNTRYNSLLGLNIILATCGFEAAAICNFKSVPGASNMKWERGNDGTPSALTGPAVDHTYGTSLGMDDKHNNKILLFSLFHWDARGTVVVHVSLTTVIKVRLQLGALI